MAVARVWTSADLAALARLTAEGLSDYVIGRRLGRTARAVERRRLAAGLRKHGRVRAAILRLVARGWATWAIALHVGRSESLVRMVRGKARREGVMTR